MSNSSVACPGDTVLFTCTQRGSALQWRVDPPAESGLMSVMQPDLLPQKLAKACLEKRSDLRRLLSAVRMEF